MSTDYEDREREFLAYLKADTGLDLAGWMAAISEAKLAHRNEIIDWLRQQGFIFAWASWMERIHHNSGRPIYLDDAPASLEQPRRTAPGTRPPPPPSGSPPTPSNPVPPPTASRHSPPPPPEREAASPRPAARPVLVYSAPAPQEPRETSPAPVPPAPPPKAPAPQPEPNPTLPGAPAETPPNPASLSAPVTLSAEVSSLVAKAKAYAPLAGFILRNINEALPGTALQVSGNYIACNRPRTFAILVPGPKDIKLGLALSEAPFERNVVAARFSKLSPTPPQSITYMAVLTDARQIDAALLDLLRAADAAING